MAFPTIPTGGRVVTGNQANATATRTFPSLTGLTKNSGDLLIAIICTYQDSAAAPIFSSWGASFTEFTDQQTTAGSTMGIGAAYKFSDGTETGTFTVTQAATPTGHASFILLSIPATHISQAPEAGTIANGTAAAADPASFDPAGWAAEDTLWIAVGASGMTSATGSWTGMASAPTNYTNYADTATTDNSTIGQTELAVAFRQLNASSENVATFSCDTSNARNSALVIAVRPDGRQTISGGVASENDSATAGSIIQPQVVAGGVASGGHSAPAGQVLQRYTAAPGNENDSTWIGYPGAGRGRTFDDVDDEITCSIGSAGVTGAWTIAALFRLNQTAESQPIVGIYDSGNTCQLGLEVASSNSPQVRTGAVARTSASDGGQASAVFASDNWVILVAAKAAGTAEASFHVWKQQTAAWNHEGTLFDFTLGNPAASTYVKFGRLGTTTAYADMTLGTAGIWNVELTNTQIEELSASLATQDWADESGGAPVGLWDFDQASVATDVVDLTGNGADQSAIVGTSVGLGPHPVWTYGVSSGQTISGGIASENDSVPAGVASVLINGGVASEGDSAPAGTVLQGFYRHFDGVDDRINIFHGDSNLVGSLTMGALIRRGRNATKEYFLGNVDNGGGPVISLGFNTSDQVACTISLTTRQTSSLTVTTSDGWVFVLLTKAAGTTTPRAHVCKAGVWTHEDLDGTLPNPGTQEIEGYIELGSRGWIGQDYALVDMVTAGEWDYVAMSDGQVEELDDDWTTTDWFNASAGVPSGLWHLEQSDVNILIQDLTGGPAYEGLRTDTEVVAGAPVRASDGKAWDPRTPLVGYRGRTLERAPAGRPMQVAGTVFEADSVPAGTVQQGSPQTISGGVASEGDSTPTGKVLQTYTASPAAESDSAAAGLVLQRYTASPAAEADKALASPGWFRRFDGVDDRVQVTNGEALLWDNLTMAAVVRKQRDGQAEWIVNNVSIGGTPCVGIGFNASNQITMRLAYGGTVRHTSTNTVTMSDGWVIVAVTKAAGTTTPRAHVWKDGSGWAHEDLDGTLANPNTQMDGYVEFGSSGWIGENSQIDLEVVGEWQANLTDGQVEELSANWATLDWFSNSGAIPYGLWNFNQSAIGDAGSGNTGINDLTGGEAGPYGMTEGSSVGSGAPVRSSDSKIWDPRTPLVGEKAHETDSPSLNNFLQGKVLQVYTASPAAESDSAPGGTVQQGSQQTISGGVASEGDSTPGGKVLQTYTASPASESDSAATGKVLQVYTASPAVENDSGAAGKVLQTYTASPAVENDSGAAGLVRQTYPASPANENDSAVGGTVQQGSAQTISGGVAVENDSSAAGQVLQTYTASPAAEANSAAAGSIIQPQLVSGGVASEQDSATASLVQQTYPAGTAAEQDSAQAGTPAQAQLVAGGVAREDDSVAAGQVQQTYTAAASSESDSVPVGQTKLTAGTAVEGDDVPNGTVDQGANQTIAGGVAQESDSLGQGKVFQVYTSGAAVESDSAPTGQVAQVYVAGTASELDSAVAGFVAQTYTAAAAAESDAANAGSVLQPYPGGASAESDSAPAGHVAQIYLAGLASEDDAAIAGKVAQLYLAGTALEQGSVPPATMSEVYPSSPAVESDSVPVGIGGAGQVFAGGVAVEVDTGPPGGPTTTVLVLEGDVTGQSTHTTEDGFSVGASGVVDR